MPKRVYQSRHRRLANQGFVRSPRSREATASAGVAMEPVVLCSVVLLAFGSSFVFGCLTSIVAFGGSMLGLLTGTVVGLTFAGTGSVLFCLGVERSDERGSKASGTITTALLAGATLAGLAFGLLL